MKHTPGEWVFMVDDIFYGEIRSVETFEVIAVMPELDDRPEDFTLIAAAPELLEVCETVLRYIGSHQIYDKDAKSILERAVTKARGEW